MPEKSTIQMDMVMSTAIAQRASDVHIRVGKPPVLVVNGTMKVLNTSVIDSAAAVAAMKAITKEREQVELDTRGGVDFAREYPNPSGGRAVQFRVNVFRHCGEVGIVMRRLPAEILTPEQIGLPPQLVQLVLRPRGLILVTGPTGSGKTTTLAGLVDYVARSTSRHIVTIEQPVEYRFEHHRSVVSQRSVPNDVGSFEEGLRQALRQAPNIIVVGEMRDLETTRVALSAAETGHLVLATLHTSSAPKTIDRLVDQFPDTEQPQIRSQLSTSLLAVLCQQLMLRSDGKGMVAAYEFMQVTPALANKIRDRKTETMESDIQSGKQLGMRLLDEHLFMLVQDGSVAREVALERANRPDQLRQRLEAGR